MVASAACWLLSLLASSVAPPILTPEEPIEVKVYVSVSVRVCMWVQWVCM